MKNEFEFDFGMTIRFTTPELAIELRDSYGDHRLSKSNARRTAMRIAEIADSISESANDTSWHSKEKSDRAKRIKRGKAKEISRREFARNRGHNNDEHTRYYDDLGRYSSHGIKRPDIHGRLDTHGEAQYVASSNGHGIYKAHGHRDRKAEFKIRDRSTEETERDSDICRWRTAEEIERARQCCDALDDELRSINDQIKKLESKRDLLVGEIFSSECRTWDIEFEYAKQRGYSDPSEIDFDGRWTFMPSRTKEEE